MKSFLSYRGGKSRLAEKVVSFIPSHECYCEVFAGAAWVLFKKDPSKAEIINDINSELTTLYRVVQNHLEEFVRYFKWALVSRDEFDRVMRESPETLTDIQRAARFFYIIKTSFGSKIHMNHFGVAPSGPPRLNLLRIEEDLSAAHMRLARVYIENLHYDKLIKRHDRPTTLFYVDPPYYGCENDYGQGIFSREDFALLKDTLAGIKGKFIMSINDVKDIRQLFKGFHIKPVTTTYTTPKTGSSGAKELLITNFKPRG